MSVRTERIGSNFVKEISFILQTEIKDPDIRFVTVTGCDVTNDLSFAKVYVTVFNKDKKEETLKALNNAANFIEVLLSKRIDIRKMPEISFHYDNSIEYGERIEKKLEELDKDK